MESTKTLLALTTGAVEKVDEFIRDHGGADTTGLRVAVLPGGCSGFQYSLNIEDRLHQCMNPQWNPLRQVPMHSLKCYR